MATADPDAVMVEAELRLQRRGYAATAHDDAAVGRSGSVGDASAVSSIRPAAAASSSFFAASPTRRDAESRYEERGRLHAENRRLRGENAYLLDQLRVARVAQRSVPGPASDALGHASVVAGARALLRQLPARHPGLGLDRHCPDAGDGAL